MVEVWILAYIILTLLFFGRLCWRSKADATGVYIVGLAVGATLWPVVLVGGALAFPFVVVYGAVQKIKGTKS